MSLPSAKPMLLYAKKGRSPQHGPLPRTPRSSLAPPLAGRGTPLQLGLPHRKSPYGRSHSCPRRGLYRGRPARPERTRPPLASLTSGRPIREDPSLRHDRPTQNRCGPHGRAPTPFPFSQNPRRSGKEVSRPSPGENRRFGHPRPPSPVRYFPACPE